MSIAKVIEKGVRRFTRKIGDWVAEGSNNTLIVLGTERSNPNGPAKVDDTPDDPDSGAIYLIVGRNDPDGNPDLNYDSTTVYASMKSSPDENLHLEGIGSKETNVSSFGVKTDAIRLVSRKNFKIVIDGSKTFFIVEDGKVTLRSGTTEMTIADGKVTLKSSEVQVDASRVEIKGKVNVVGEVTSNGVPLSTHTHIVPGIAPGGGSTTSTPPTPLP